jgi:hypothetical protein
MSHLKRVLGACCCALLAAIGAYPYLRAGCATWRLDALTESAP